MECYGYSSILPNFTILRFLYASEFAMDETLKAIKENLRFVQSGAYKKITPGIERIYVRK